MEHSEHFKMIKDYYDRKLWSAARVRRAVTCRYITADECAEILGE